MKSFLRSVTAGLCVASLVGVACSSKATTTPSSAPATTSAPITGTVTVFAASSLTTVFTEMGTAFGTVHPGSTIKFNFNGSSTLATQISQGAPADVFASADNDTMQRLVTANLVPGTAKVFAHNRLQIVVAKGNPKQVTGLADLARTSLVTVLCAPSVPCGKYANQALAAAGVTPHPVSLEQNVKSLVGKIALGEADIGIGYVTDVQADSGVSGVDIPDNQNVIATYPLAALRSSTNPVTAQAFVDFVLSPSGQAVMAKYGFLGL